jgi:hypothetical protein
MSGSALKIEADSAVLVTIGHPQISAVLPYIHIPIRIHFLPAPSQPRERF